MNFVEGKSSLEFREVRKCEGIKILIEDEVEAGGEETSGYFSRQN